MHPDKASVLIAEDNVNDVFLLKNAFQEAAPKVRINVVENGEEFIRYLTPKPGAARNPIPAFVLLDLKMPKVDGFEVLQWVRHQPELRRLLIIVLSSSNEAGQINRAYDLGANSYLTKPFDYQGLTVLVRKLLSYWVDANLAPTFSPVVMETSASETDVRQMKAGG
jgi:CheY-like chemotaxis protein